MADTKYCTINGSPLTLWHDFMHIVGLTSHKQRQRTPLYPLFTQLGIKLGSNFDYSLYVRMKDTIELHGSCSCREFRTHGIILRNKNNSERVVRFFYNTCLNLEIPIRNFRSCRFIEWENQGKAHTLFWQKMSYRKIGPRKQCLRATIIIISYVYVIYTNYNEIRDVVEIWNTMCTRLFAWVWDEWWEFIIVSFIRIKERDIIRLHVYHWENKYMYFEF